MGTYGQFGKRLTLLAAALIPPAGPPPSLQLPCVLLDFDTTNAPPDFDVATTPPSDIWQMLEAGTLTVKDMDGYEAQNREARQRARRLGLAAPKAYCGFHPDDDGIDDQ